MNFKKKTFPTENNQIKHMNGAVFERLPKLSQVFLNPNPCISIDFDTPSRVKDMVQVISGNCAFEE